MSLAARDPSQALERHRAIHADAAHLLRIAADLHRELAHRWEAQGNEVGAQRERRLASRTAERADRTHRLATRVRTNTGPERGPRAHHPSAGTGSHDDLHGRRARQDATAWLARELDHLEYRTVALVSVSTRDASGGDVQPPAALGFALLDAWGVSAQRLIRFLLGTVHPAEPDLTAAVIDPAWVPDPRVAARLADALPRLEHLFGEAAVAPAGPLSIAADAIVADILRLTGELLA